MWFIHYRSCRYLDVFRVEIKIFVIMFRTFSATTTAAEAAAAATAESRQHEPNAKNRLKTTCLKLKRLDKTNEVCERCDNLDQRALDHEIGFHMLIADFISYFYANRTVRVVDSLLLRISEDAVHTPDLYELIRCNRVVRVLVRMTS